MVSADAAVSAPRVAPPDKVAISVGAVMMDYKTQELEELLNPPTKYDFRAALIAAVVVWMTITMLCIAGLYL